jgi:hypothetical protein
MQPYHWMILIAQVMSIGFFGLRALTFAAYINENSSASLEKFIILRHLLQRMIHDPRIFLYKFKSGSQDNQNALAYIDLQAQIDLRTKRLIEAGDKFPDCKDEDKLIKKCEPVTPDEIF